MCSVLPPTFTYMALVSCYHIHRISISYTTTFTSRSRCRSHRGEKIADGLGLLLGGRQCMHVHHMPIRSTKSHYRSLSCVLRVTRYSVDQLHHMHSCSDPTKATTRDRHPRGQPCFLPFSFLRVWSVKPTTQSRPKLCTHIYYEGEDPNKKVGI